MAILSGLGSVVVEILDGERRGGEQVRLDSLMISLGARLRPMGDRLRERFVQIGQGDDFEMGRRDGVKG